MNSLKRCLVTAKKLNQQEKNVIKKYWGFQIPTDVILKMREAALKTTRTMSDIVLSGIEWELDRISKTPTNDGVRDDLS